MRIPEVRDRLRQLAVERDIPELASLADQLHRRKPVKRSPEQNLRMTPALRAEIEMIAGAHPRWSHQQIANRVGVNPGRVSEVLAGFRE